MLRINISIVSCYYWNSFFFFRRKVEHLIVFLWLRCATNLFQKLCVENSQKTAHVGMTGASSPFRLCNTIYKFLPVGDYKSRSQSESSAKIGNIKKGKYQQNENVACLGYLNELWLSNKQINLFVGQLEMVCCIASEICCIFFRK